MDSGVLAKVIPLFAIIGGVVTWPFRQYWHRREFKKRSAHDGNEILRQQKSHLERFKRSLGIKPGYPDAFNNRGIAYHKPGKYDKALRDFNRDLKLKPNDPDTLYNRGNTYGEIGKYDEALSDYNRALELKPDYPNAFNNRGIAYHKLGRYDEALRDFNHTLELKPDDPCTLYNLACLFSFWSKPDEALDYLQKAIKGDKKYRKMAKTDEDLDNIRDDPRFNKLLAGN
jgi:tetratricopeptide (TPR) repeat protein